MKIVLQGHLGEAWLFQAGMSGEMVGLAEMNPPSPGRKGVQGKTRVRVGTRPGLVDSRGPSAHHTMDGGISATSTGRLQQKQMNQCSSSEFPQETQTQTDES